MNVVSLFHDSWPKLKTLGELVDLARAIPQTKILDTIVKQTREIERLHKTGAGRASLLRQLIVTGVLINRAVFEIYGVPKQRSYPIEAPDELKTATSD